MTLKLAMSLQREMIGSMNGNVDVDVDVDGMDLTQ